jgi:hypothetical protein
VTHQQELIAALRRNGPMTMMELERLGISSCPWRRLSDDENPQKWLKGRERLARKTGKDGLVRIYIAR